MKNSPDLLALQHIQAVCHGHAEALSEALQDMQLRTLILRLQPVEQGRPTPGAIGLARQCRRMDEPATSA